MRRTTGISRRCIATLAAAAVLSWSLSLACLSPGSANARVRRPPTLGSELMSLHTAHDEGLLSDGEYLRRREQTISMWKRIADAPIDENPYPWHWLSDKLAPDAEPEP